MAKTLLSHYESILHLGEQMRLLLLSFSLALSCYGQPYGFGNLPFLGGGGSLFPPGLMFRWIDRDLTNGNIAIWTDEVQHNNAVTNSVTPPLMTSTGLFFTASCTMKFTNANGNALVGNSVMGFCVYYISDVTGGNDTFAINDNTGSPTSESFIAGNPRDSWRRFLNGTGTFTISGTIPTNTVVDFESGTNSANNLILFTNGVVDATTPGNSSIAGLGVNLDSLGNVNSSWVLREYDMFTNVTLTSTIASNLNYYRKITYGGN